MKFKARLLSITVSLALLLTACNGVFKKDEPAANNNMGMLQGQIFDAKTGAALAGEDLRIYLVQGTADRTPDKMNRDSADPLMGEYAFANIPISSTTNAFKLVVIKPGYQKFESEFTFATAGTTYYISKIGNVYLYPTGSVANPVDINVTDSYGKAVAGATVQLLQSVTSNTTPALASPNTLTPTLGLLPALTTSVTDAAGKATFASSVLGLGISYTPVALALTANGLNLATTTGSAITIGSTAAGVGPQVQQLKMSTSTYGALALVAQSNVAGVAPLASGVLNLVFNQPFTIDSNAQWSATVTGTINGAVPPAATTYTRTFTTTVGTVTGASLVLTPPLTTADTSGLNNVSIVYTLQSSGALGVPVPQVYLTSTGANATTVFNTLLTAATRTVKIAN